MNIKGFLVDLNDTILLGKSQKRYTPLELNIFRRIRFSEDPKKEINVIQKELNWTSTKFWSCVNKIYSGLSVHTDLLDFLKFKRKHGYLIALISNTGSYISKIMLKKLYSLDLERLFDFLFFTSDIGLSKYQPEIYSYAVKEMGLLPKNVVLIDNSEKYIAAANKAGINGILAIKPSKTIKLIENFLE